MTELTTTHSTFEAEGPDGITFASEFKSIEKQNWLTWFEKRKKKSKLKASRKSFGGPLTMF